VEGILRDRGWLSDQSTPEMGGWIRDAAEWLGLQVALHSANEGQTALAELLTLVFVYDAASVLKDKTNQAVMAREGAREVIRELANRVLDGGDIDSERFREIVAQLKAIFGSHGRKIFYPLRLALAGRCGEGELDRVILLLDRAAKLPFGVPVKGTRQRVLEFCAALS
jgi:nondiscriminating glutamyl-tRNA synthetase